MRDLRHRLDSAILLITHDMGVVADLADDIVVMRKGEIVERGTVPGRLRRSAAPVHAAAAGSRAAHRRGRRASPIDTTAALSGDTTQIRLAEVAARAGRRSGARASPIRCSRSRTSRSTIRSGGACRRSAPSSMPRSRSTPVRSRDWSASRARERPRSAAPPSVSSRSPTAGRRSSGTTSPRPTGGCCTACTRTSGIVFQDPSSSLNPRLPIGAVDRRADAARREAQGARSRQARAGCCWTPSSCRARTATATRTNCQVARSSVSASRARWRCSRSC